MTELYIARTAPFCDQVPAARAMPLLDGERRERTARLRRPEDRARSVTAGLLLRFGLAERFGLPPGSCSIERGENGKPFVKGRPDCCFNLSHAGEWAVCALSAAPVGVDIERAEGRHEDLARRFFCPEEFAWLGRQPEDGREEAFFRLWTLKESYIKYLGKGLSLSLSAFCIHPGPPVAVTQEGKHVSCRFREYSDCIGYRLAVCAAGGEDIAPRPRLLDTEALLGTLA